MFTTAYRDSPPFRRLRTFGLMRLIVAGFIAVFTTFSGLLLDTRSLSAQPLDTASSAPQGYTSINENQLADTKWRFAYATYVGSKSPILVADQNYNHYLWLKYDYTFDQYLSGNQSHGIWSLNERKNRIYYKFKNVKWWDIAEFTENRLVIEMVDNNGAMQYIFQRMPDNAAPFGRDKSMLAKVEIVDKMTPKVREARKRTNLFAWLFPQKRGDLARDTSVKKPIYNPNRRAEPTPIEIVLIGGGYYGGMNPVLKNYIQIKTTGRIIKEYETVEGGLQKVKKEISRQELERLMKFIMDKRFFEFQNFYDCNTPDCRSRKATKPTPIPLRLYVQYGDRKKMVNITIWGQEGNSSKVNYVSYPPEIDAIINSILSLAGT